MYSSEAEAEVFERGREGVVCHGWVGLWVDGSGHFVLGQFLPGHFVENRQKETGLKETGQKETGHKLKY